MLGRILLVGFGLLATVYFVTMAIIAAAPWLALGIVGFAVAAFLWWIDYPSGNNKKPP